MPIKVSKRVTCTVVAYGALHVCKVRYDHEGFMRVVVHTRPRSARNKTNKLLRVTHGNGRRTVRPHAHQSSPLCHVYGGNLRSLACVQSEIYDNEGFMRVVVHT